MSKNRFLVILLAFVALGSLGLADFASACDQQCQVVSPPFCRRCVDTGTYTGTTCQNTGSCGCFFTQNTCGLFAATAATAPEKDFLVAQNAATVSASDTFQLDLALAIQ